MLKFANQLTRDLVLIEQGEIHAQIRVTSMGSDGVPKCA